MPRLAPHLPLAVPAPVAVGEPDFDYPWPWAVSPLAARDEATRSAIAQVGDAFDAAAMTELEAEEPTWTRGRGWAPATGLNAYISCAAANPRVAEQTTRQITQALAG